MFIYDVLYYIFIIIGAGFILLMISSFIVAYPKALNTKINYMPKTPKQIQIELDGGAEKGYNDIVNEKLSDEDKILEAKRFFLEINNDIIEEQNIMMHGKFVELLKENEFNHEEIKYIGEKIDEGNSYIHSLLDTADNDLIMKVMNHELPEDDLVV